MRLNAVYLLRLFGIDAMREYLGLEEYDYIEKGSEKFHFRLEFRGDYLYIEFEGNIIYTEVTMVNKVIRLARRIGREIAFEVEGEDAQLYKEYLEVS